MDRLLNTWDSVTSLLDDIGHWIAPLALRSIMGYEYFEAGLMKLRGDNWFGGIQDSFPFPFNVIPADLSWFIATWAELVGGIALWLGLGTRFFAATLMILTVVAALAVHWPQEWNTLAELWQGYAISDDGFGNYKLPLLFFIMLTPLLLLGGGKLSLDHFIYRAIGR